MIRLTESQARSHILRCENPPPQPPWHPAYVALHVQREATTRFAALIEALRRSSTVNRKS